MVDDDPDVRDSLRDLLEEECGCRVLTAGNHAEAQRACGDSAPDLALLDVSLGPDESGLELIPKLRELHPDLVCVVMTAYRDAEYAADAVRRGADDYLFKPLDPEQLLELLPKHLERQQAVREKAEADRELHRLAFHDPLTGLANRTRFNEAIRRMMSQSRRHQRQLALMFLDLDGFKAVNDSMGHEAGDRLLELVADRLRDTIRLEDALFRFGGDEFTILLADVRDRDTALAAAQRTLDALAHPYALKGREVNISASIGVVFYPYNGDDAETLLQRADQAMYRAKEQGKNRYVAWEG